MTELYRPVFEIAGVTVGFDREEPLFTEEHYLPFVTDESAAWEITFRRVNVLPSLSSDDRREELSYRFVTLPNGDEEREFFDSAHSGEVFALGRYRWSQKRIELYWLAGAEEFVRESRSCFYYLALEKLLQKEGRAILHASCVETPSGAVLFCGPSGVGKSTQSELWVKNRACRVINGDRTVLAEVNGRWTAFGSPYAGSSRIWLNESCPVRAIVLLDKSETNSVLRLSGVKAFRAVFSVMTANSRDRQSVVAAMDLAEKIVAKVPVFSLACRADISAVEALEKLLP